MIERYTLTATGAELRDRYRIEVPDFYEPRYNAAPTQLLPVITQSGPEGLSWFYWGMVPEWAKNKSLPEKAINIRREYFPEKSALQRTLRRNRCLIPADGFYCWRRTGKRTLIPYRFIFTGEPLLAIAGIWEEFEDTADGKTYHTFSMITTTSPDSGEAIAERIPFVLPRTAEKVWLSGSDQECLELLALPGFHHFDHYPVSPRISDATINSPGLIKATAPADQFGNLTLFD